MSNLAIFLLVLIVGGGAVLYPVVEDKVTRRTAPPRRRARLCQSCRARLSRWNEFGLLQDRARWDDEIERRVKGTR